MEVAGLVLCATPLALYVIDKYSRCIQLTADFLRYEDTIKLIRNYVTVQVEQLRMTFRCIGPGQPSLFEPEHAVDLPRRVRRVPRRHLRMTTESSIDVAI